MISAKKMREEPNREYLRTNRPELVKMFIDGFVAAHQTVRLVTGDMCVRHLMGDALARDEILDAVRDSEIGVLSGMAFLPKPDGGSMCVWLSPDSCYEQICIYRHIGADTEFEVFWWYDPD